MMRLVFAMLVALTFTIQVDAQEKKPQQTGTATPAQDQQDQAKALAKQVEDLGKKVGRLEQLADSFERGTALQNIETNMKSMWTWMFLIGTLIALVFVVSFWVVIPRNLAIIGTAIGGAVSPIETLACRTQTLGTQLDTLNSDLTSLTAKTLDLSTKLETAGKSVDAVTAALASLAPQQNAAISQRLDAINNSLAQVAGRIDELAKRLPAATTETPK